MGSSLSIVVVIFFFFIFFLLHDEKAATLVVLRRNFKVSKIDLPRWTIDLVLPLLMSAEEHERTKGIIRKLVTDEIRLYENIWKTRQKIIYNDKKKLGISFNENSKKNK